MSGTINTTVLWDWFRFTLRCVQIAGRQRQFDTNAPIYRRAVSRMKDATRVWIDYTNQRRKDIEEAKREKRQRARYLFIL